MSRNKVLVLDDETQIVASISDYLKCKGYTVIAAYTCAEAEHLFRTLKPDIALLDNRLPDGEALTLIQKLKQFDPNVPVIVMTGQGSIDLAVRAIKIGAEQFLTKPLELAALETILDRALETQRIRDTQAARKLQQARRDIDPFLGHSPAIRQLADAAKRVAASDAVVLIQGDTGVGKGVLARWIHENSNRAEEALVDLNCAGFTREFLETELFGYEKGAYTGAANAKQGLLEVAHRGTVFLDEIGDMDLQIQPKLLKVLEEKMLRRLGELRDRRVDIRLIAATHQDLAKLSRENRFRSDLYFRISAIPLRVPSLRERPEDVEILANHLLRRCGIEMGRTVELTTAALDALRAYSWPGNIRELKNVIERAVLLSDSAALAPNDLQFEQNVDEGQPSGIMQLIDLERFHIMKVLAATRGNVVRAAKILGVPRSSLYRKVKEFNIALPE